MVYVFLADGFEEIEALGTVDILRRSELDVKTVSINETLEVCGTHGIKVFADILTDEVKENEVDAIVLPGGLPGADNLENCKFVTDLIAKANSEGKIIAAICAAPKIPGVLGLLNGLHATCVVDLCPERRNACAVCAGDIQRGYDAQKCFPDQRSDTRTVCEDIHPG